MDNQNQLTIHIERDHPTDKVSTDSSKECHNTQSLNGINSDENTLQIVNMLGGIDQILSDYLNNFGQNKVAQIHELLWTAKKYQQHNQLKPVSIIDDKDKDPKSQEDHASLCYEFVKNETVLHSLFGEKVAMVILNIFHSKIMRIIFYLSTLSWLILVFTFSETLFIETYEVAFLCTLCIPNLIFWLLSSNRDGIKLILKTFEFWIKIYYSVHVHTLTCYYYYHRDLRAHRQYLYLAMNLISSILWLISLTLWVAVISSFDAMKVGRKWKIFFCALAGITCFMFSVEYQFLSPQSDDIVIHIPAFDSILSFQSMIADAYIVLAIFFIKQAFFAYYRKGRATIIKYIPFIKWIDDPTSDSEVKSDKIATNDGQTSSDETDIEMHEMKVNNLDIKEMREVDNDITTDDDDSGNDEDFGSVKL